MKKLFITIAAIIALAGCKKEKVETSPAPQPEPVFTKKLSGANYSYLNGTNTYTSIEKFEYDTEGRLKLYIDDDYTYTMDYSIPGKIITTEKYQANLKYTYEATTNSKGLIINVVMKKPDGSTYYTFTYTYDANDYVIKEESVFYNGETTKTEYKVENGNVTEWKQYRNSQLNSTWVFDFTNSFYNSLEWRHSASWPGSSFGKKSKNLHTGYKVTQANGTVSASYKIEYQKDGAGYIVSEKRTSLINNITNNITYTYQ